ncbi:type II toxin-antitoxin system RelE/ParE family toxin [Vibrio paracholerae]|uniref:type II toxin-antitoxin system RelE/ParE family toxin n=3 Tax=Vibrionaceae TaxID=641 RepID=UPI001F332E48|nr:type II toxin-antitoxin system RelE/ParE family toxin [Vibrio paracholerae]
MYKLSQKAADDFGDIYEYTFLNFGAEQADNYTDEMEQCLQTLSEAPFIGRDCSELRSGVRRHDHQKHAIFLSNSRVRYICYPDLAPTDELHVASLET